MGIEVAQGDFELAGGRTGGSIAVHNEDEMVFGGEANLDVMTFKFRDSDGDCRQFDSFKQKFVFFRVERSLLSLMVDIFFNHEAERVQVHYSVLLYRFPLEFFQIIRPCLHDQISYFRYIFLSYLN